MAYLRPLLLQILRSDDNLLPYMDKDGFFPESIVKTAMEHYMHEKLSPEVFAQIVDGFAKAIERVDTPDKRIKATFGHSGKIALALNWGRYVPYPRPERHRIFCITHFTRNGLGSINYNRTFNLLTTPERCENKGVKAYINIVSARENGVEFWSQVGDRYGNKIFCFDPTLVDHIEYVEYTHDYTNPERIRKTQAGCLETIKAVCGVDEESAVKHLQKLFFEYDADDECEVGYDNDVHLDLENLKI